MFELETALANWKRSLVSNDTVGLEEALELEEHLRESVTGLSSIGLSQREAFLVGADRLGHPSELEQEYAKVNVVAQWQKRVFWMLTGYIAMLAAGSVVSVIVTIASTGMTLAGAGGTATGIVVILVMALAWIGLAVVAYRQYENLGARGDCVRVKWLVATGILLVLTPFFVYAGQFVWMTICGPAFVGETLLYSYLGGSVIRLCVIAFCFVVICKFNNPAASAFDSATTNTN